VIYKDSIASNNINTEDFFNIIRDKKSDFAYYLNQELEDNGNHFTIPKYIEEGFDLLTVKKNNA
jgi:hypothetical protein